MTYFCLAQLVPAEILGIQDCICAQECKRGFLIYFLIAVKELLQCTFLNAQPCCTHTISNENAGEKGVALSAVVSIAEAWMLN